jgi:hypothetical protein
MWPVPNVAMKPVGSSWAARRISDLSFGRLGAVAGRTGWEPLSLEAQLKATVPGSRHDRLDAYMAAWVASLAPERRRAFGYAQQPDDSIWVPLVGMGRPEDWECSPWICRFPSGGGVRRRSNAQSPLAAEAPLNGSAWSHCARYMLSQLLLQRRPARAPTGSRVRRRSSRSDPKRA